MDAQRGDTATARHEVVENYWWYAEGCRHPVFEYAKHTSYSAGQAVGRVSTAYCVSIDGTLDTLIQADSEASPSAEEIQKGFPSITPYHRKVMCCTCSIQSILQPM